MEIPILQKKIADLNLEVEALKSVQKSEVLMNYDLKCYNKKLEIQIQELVKINESFLDQIVKLRIEIENQWNQKK
jgi:hypothetical protein